MSKKAEMLKEAVERVCKEIEEQHKNTDYSAINALIAKATGATEEKN